MPVWFALNPSERGERRGARDGQRDDRARVEPVEALAALEQRLQRADAERQQREAEEVDARDLAHVTRIGQQPERQRERERAERQVDVEDPRPRQRVRQPAAERGPERRSDHDAHAEDGHGHAEFLGREHFVEHGLRRRQQRAAAQTLHDAPRHELGQRVRVAAEERGDGEQRDRPGEVAAPAEERRQPAGDRQHDHVRHDVAGRHPGDLVQRCAQVPHHVRDRDVHDAGVEQLHDRRQRDRDRDQIAIRVRGSRQGVGRTQRECERGHGATSP